MKRVGNMIESKYGRVILFYHSWELYHIFEFLPYICLKREFSSGYYNIRIGWLFFQIKIIFKPKTKIQ